MSGEVIDEDAVKPSGGVAGRDHVGFPVSLPIFAKQTRRRRFINARESVGAQDFSGGAYVPLDGGLGGTVEVLDAAGPILRGASARLETPGYGVHHVVRRLTAVPVEWARGQKGGYNLKCMIG